MSPQTTTPTVRAAITEPTQSSSALLPCRVAGRGSPIEKDRLTSHPVTAAAITTPIKATRRRPAGRRTCVRGEPVERFGLNLLPLQVLASFGVPVTGRPARRRLAVRAEAVSYTHLRAHETRHDLVCRLL